jgi:oligosaccharide repeat unit polymerase
MPSLLATLATVALLIGFAGTIVTVVYRYIQRDLFHPLVLVTAIMVYYVFLPSVGLLTGIRLRFENAHTHLVTELAVALAVIFASFLLIIGAFHRTDFTKRTQTVASKLRTTERIIDMNVLVLLGLLGFVAGLVCYLYYVFVNGGFVRLATVTPRTAFQTVPNTGRFYVLGMGGLYAGLFTVFTGLRRRFERGVLARGGYLILGGMFVVVMVAAILHRGRMGILLPAAYVLLYLQTSRHVPTKWIIGGGGVVFVFGIAFASFEALFRAGGSFFNLLVRSLFQVSYLETIMIVFRDVPSEYPLQWGGTFLWILMWRFPRLPPNYGTQMELIVWGATKKNITLPAMMYGELWLNFWFIGVLVGSVVIGALLKTIYQTRAVERYLADGLYPLALLIVMTAITSSIEFAITSVFIRMVAPVLLAICVAWGIARLRQPTGYERMNG